MPLGASGQLAAVLADSAESQAGRMLRAALSHLGDGVPGPCWAAWPCSQIMLLLPDVLWTDYSFSSEQMLNAAMVPGFLYCAPLIFLLCHWLDGRGLGMVR